MEDEKDSLPLFMDDPLTQYDDKRAETALEYLKKYSDSHQLIIFTCHSKIKDTAAKLGAKIKDM
jgi:uncharacterized protein YhaN